jgi:hypothetical protein
VASSIFCDVNVPDYVQEQCGAELGGIVAIALIDADQSPSKIDLQTLSFWNTKLAASPQSYWVVKDTRGTYAGGTPVEEEGFGKVPTLRTGADHEATVEVRGVEDNRPFWASVNQTAKWNVVLITNGELGLYFEDASIYAKVMIDQSIKSSIRWSVSIKWSDDMSNPVVFDASPLDSIFS